MVPKVRDQREVGRTEAIRDWYHICTLRCPVVGKVGVSNHRFFSFPPHLFNGLFNSQIPHDVADLEGVVRQ